MYTRRESELIQQYLQQHGQLPGAGAEVDDLYDDTVVSLELVLGSRAMTEDQRVLTQELEAQGWVRRFTVEAERADEYVELYQSLGDEVRVEPVTPELLAVEECADCLLAASDKYIVIYTRPTDV